MLRRLPARKIVESGAGILMGQVHALADDAGGSDGARRVVEPISFRA